MWNQEKSSRMKSKIRLIKNIIALVIVGFLGYLVYNFFFSKESTEEWEIENTPLHVESIRTISEIATVSYKDEVVVDTIEYYKNTEEQISGNLNKLIDPKEWKYGLKASKIKRRMTLIVKGEVRYGMDLTSKNYKISQNQDTIWFNLPKPVILDILVTPSSTEVFQENGTWNDNDRKLLETKAKIKLKRSAENLKLYEKSKNSVCDLFERMIVTDKKMIFYFDR